MFLALILSMQKLTPLLFIFVAANPHVMFAQKDSTEHTKQRRAGQVADRFVNRFRATLDFGMAWKVFRLSDPSCTHRETLLALIEFYPDRYTQFGVPSKSWTKETFIF